MAAAEEDWAGGDGSCHVQDVEARETTPLIPPVYHSNGRMQGRYQSHSVSVEGGQGEEGGRSLIGPPQGNEEVAEMEVVVEKDSNEPGETTSDVQCLMHILKGNIGTGVLAMPIAVKHAGLWFGLAGILFLGLVATHCMHLLVKASKILARRTVGSDKLSYADVMEMALMTGPIRFRKLAPYARCVVNALLLFTQYGFCCVYIVFIASNIKQVVDISYPDSLNLRLYELAVSALLLMYCMLKDLRTLAPFSMFANILTLAGMVLIFINISQDLRDSSTLPSIGNFKEMPLFFGQAIFAFEGISLVLPLEASMKERHRFGGLVGILNLSMVIVTALYCAVGFYGYLKFGDDVAGSITLNLPDSEWYYVIVKPMFSITIFVSYNVQLYVAIQIILPWLCSKLNKHTDKQKDRVEYALRAVSVLGTMLFAMAIPHLDLLIALIGALASSSLATILPIIINLLTIFSQPRPPSPIICIKDLFIALLGFIGFTTGTYSAMRDIVNKF